MDCGTGNGQVAKELALRFKKVLATDLSAQQLEHASGDARITYLQCPAEKLEGIPDDSFDLVTVGTALHWFDHEAFFKEARRVAKGNAFFAAWCYGNFRSAPEVNMLMDDFYSGTVGQYWDPERKLVEDAYRGIHIPFEEIAAPQLNIELEWNVGQLEGYLNTWSAVQNYIKANGVNPVPSFIETIKPAWKEKQSLYFPLHIRAGHFTASA